MSLASIFCRGLVASQGGLGASLQPSSKKNRAASEACGGREKVIPLGGLLPTDLVLGAMNHVAPEILCSFLCQLIKEPLSIGAKLKAIKWLKNAALKLMKLNRKEKDSAIEILKNLTKNTHPQVCNSAYVALGQVGEAKSKDYLKNAFNQAQRGKMPFQTQMSILKGLIAGGVTPDDELMFVRLTYSGFIGFRIMSVRALRQVGEKYWQRLSDMAESDPNAEVKIEAINALVKIDSTTAHKVLIKLRDNNPEEKVKNTISSWIQKYREAEEQPLQSTISELQSSNHRIRRKAAKSLGKLKHDSAVRLLCDALKDEDGIVRTVAAEALGSIGNKSASFPLIEALENDSYHDARAAAAKALGRCGKIGDKRIFEALLKGHNDRSPRVRKWCFFSLKRISG